MSKEIRIKFIQIDNKIIAISYYKKKKITGVARCNLNEDNFSYEKGRALAKARCEKKFAKEKLKTAEKKYFETLEEYNAVKEKLSKNKVFLRDAIDLMKKTESELNKTQKILERKS